MTDGRADGLRTIRPAQTLLGADLGLKSLMINCCWLTDIVTGVGQNDVHMGQDDFYRSSCPLMVGQDAEFCYPL